MCFKRSTYPIFVKLLTNNNNNTLHNINKQSAEGRSQIRPVFENPFAISPRLESRLVVASYTHFWKVSLAMDRHTRMIPPHELFTTPIDEVVLGVHITFMGLPNASDYQDYAFKLGYFLRTHHLQKSAFSQQGAAFSVAKDSLDDHGFPKPQSSRDTSVVSLKVALPDPDPKKFYYYNDRTVNVTKCHPSMVLDSNNENYYSSDGHEWQASSTNCVRSDLDEFGFPISSFSLQTQPVAIDKLSRYKFLHQMDHSDYDLADTEFDRLPNRFDNPLSFYSKQSAVTYSSSNFRLFV